VGGSERPEPKTKVRDSSCEKRAILGRTANFRKKNVLPDRREEMKKLSPIGVEKEAGCDQEGTGGIAVRGGVGRGGRKWVRGQQTNNTQKVSWDQRLERSLKRSGRSFIGGESKKIVPAAKERNHQVY